MANIFVLQFVELVVEIDLDRIVSLYVHIDMMLPTTVMGICFAFLILMDVHVTSVLMVLLVTHVSIPIVI